MEKVNNLDTSDKNSCSVNDNNRSFNFSKN